MHIAFDVGNVLIQVDLEEFFVEFKRFGLRADPLTFINDIQARQDIGLETLREALGTRFGLSGSQVKRLEKAWDDTIKPNYEMLNFVDGLKAARTKVAILSNMGPEHAACIRKEHSRVFNGCKLHLSSEVGARKPSKLYYQSFLMQHPSFRGCLFLDDRVENLVAAEEFGFKCRHFKLSRFAKLSATERIEVLASIKNDLYQQEAAKAELF
jgi:FMN phosphatase YigB (HAD superfamily)